MKEAPPDERKGPQTWVETRGIEPRTSCLQSRGRVVVCSRWARARHTWWVWRAA